MQTLNNGYTRPLRAECGALAGYIQAIAVRVVHSRWTNAPTITDWSMIDFNEAEAVLDAATNWPTIQYLGGR